MAQLFKTCGDNNQTLCELNNTAVQVYNSVDDLNAAYALGCINDGDIVAVPDSCYQATTNIEINDNLVAGNFPLHIADTSVWDNVPTSCNNNFIIGSGCYAVCGSAESYSGATATYNNNIYIGTSNTVKADENEIDFACTSNNTIIGFNNTIPSGGRNTVIGSDNNVCGVTCDDQDTWSEVHNNIIIGHNNCAYNMYKEGIDTDDEPWFDSNNQIIIGCCSSAHSGITIGNNSCNKDLFDTVLIGNNSYAFSCCGFDFTISKLWEDNEYYATSSGECGYGTHCMYEIKFARGLAYCQCTCVMNCDVYNAFAAALCCIGCNFTNCPGWLTGTVNGNTWVRCGSSPNCVCSQCGIENMYMSSSYICFRLNGGGCAICYGNNTTANVRHFVGSMTVMKEF